MLYNSSSVATPFLQQIRLPCLSVTINGTTIGTMPSGTMMRLLKPMLRLLKQMLHKGAKKENTVSVCDNFTFLH
jgi:hypothetical protein